MKQPAPMGHGQPRPRKQHRSFAGFEGFYSPSAFGLSMLPPPVLTFGISELAPSLPALPYLLPRSCKVANSSSRSVFMQAFVLLGRPVRTSLLSKRSQPPAKPPAAVRP